MSMSLTGSEIVDIFLMHSKTARVVRPSHINPDSSTTGLQTGRRVGCVESSPTHRFAGPSHDPRWRPGDACELEVVPDLAQIRDNLVTVLTNRALTTDAIDPAGAARELEKALEQRAISDQDFDQKSRAKPWLAAGP